MSRAVCMEKAMGDSGSPLVSEISVAYWLTSDVRVDDVLGGGLGTHTQIQPA